MDGDSDAMRWRLVVVAFRTRQIRAEAQHIIMIVVKFCNK